VSFREKFREEVFKFRRAGGRGEGGALGSSYHTGFPGEKGHAEGDEGEGDEGLKGDGKLGYVLHGAGHRGLAGQGEEVGELLLQEVQGADAPPIRERARL
jgi:hypothetical protein